MTSPQAPLLMTPGPTRVPERVLRAGARPMIHHRSPEFSSELATAMELLGPVFGTRSAPLPVHTTGRGALEATICNLFSPGDAIAVCCNGKFGEMWAKFAESYGLIVHRFSTDWERDASAAELEQLLAENSSVRAVALAYVDTSTGVANDIRAIARVARARGALVLVDGVPSIGGMPFAFDDWDIDVAVTASQKCLMSSPGLSWVAVSERGWRAVATSRLPRHYWDFAAIRRTTSATKPETPGTAPVHIVLQVAEALRMIHDEGLANVYDRHSAMARRVTDGVAELGLSLQCPALEHRSTTLTVIELPADVAPRGIRDALKARGIWTAAGLGPYERHGFRIGHMGDIRMDDVERTLSALRDALATAQSGVAVAAQ
ncbi:MAG TPA: alanine--glyoxylate aminotransferase family protein [Gemmatimonadaceae bacterium]|nr:alanine--glyoxylate aminotransferase family protein [Gemmatimonadaceae bacterium]